MFDTMLRMDAVARTGCGEKVIINMDHVAGIEERIGDVDEQTRSYRRTCIIHFSDGRVLEVNEKLDDIWNFMDNLRKKNSVSNPDKMSDKPHCFDPDKRVEHVM